MDADQTEKTLHILLIDDEPSVLRALELLLQAVGHQVHAFSIPGEAIEWLKSHTGQPISLILCDLRMPDMNGLETLSEVRRIDPNVPFILISAHADDDDVQQAYELGATGFLSKPFTPDQLRAVVSEIEAAA